MFLRRLLYRIIKVKTQKRPGFCPFWLAIAFAKWPICHFSKSSHSFNIKCRCFSHKTSLMCVYGYFLCYSGSLKFIPMVGHL